MTRDDDSETGASSKRRKRSAAKKERVLHTRVPAVLEQELKRLASNLRVPVSNVVRAILEDAVDAVDTVSERAEGGLIGFVERLAEQREDLRHRVTGQGDEEPAAVRESDASPAPPPAASPEPSPCPAEAPELLEGLLGYQPLVLAAERQCDVCGRTLAPGVEAHRAIYEEPGRKALLGPECRLVPEKEI